MVIIVLFIAGVIIIVVATAGTGTADPGDNDLTGPNADFGKSLMGDDDEFGKGL